MKRKTKCRLLLSLIVLSLSPMLFWVRVAFDIRPLNGLRLGGVEVPIDEPIDEVLQKRAKIWADTPVEIKAGYLIDRRMRRELGGFLEVEPAAERVRRLGRSGNPIRDLRNIWAARRGKLDLDWIPTIDMQRLGRYVERKRERLELPPKVGISDGQGWSIPGSDGVTLDYHRAVLSLQRALRHNEKKVSLALRKIPAPEPIVIGSPDGILFEDAVGLEEAEIEAQPTRAQEQLPIEYSNLQWLPSRGKECYEKPPLRPFCDGPRMVPRPYGSASELAKSLGLGQNSTVRQLFRDGPSAQWIQIAGGLVDFQPILWPVPRGWFGRGFGYVRKRKEVRNRLHKGVDAVAPRGSHILAVGNGIVVYSDNGIRGYGNLLIIVHSDGAITLSAHCSRIFVFAGQRVTAGQVVAEVGSTGMSMGSHLHFEYRVHGKPIDPSRLFEHVPKRRRP